MFQGSIRSKVETKEVCRGKCDGYEARGWRQNEGLEGKRKNQVKANITLPFVFLSKHNRRPLLLATSSEDELTDLVQWLPDPSCLSVFELYSSTHNS